MPESIGPSTYSNKISQTVVPSRNTTPAQTSAIATTAAILANTLEGLHPEVFEHMIGMLTRKGLLSLSATSQQVRSRLQEIYLSQQPETIPTEFKLYANDLQDIHELSTLLGNLKEAAEHGPVSLRINGHDAFDRFDVPSCLHVHRLSMGISSVADIEHRITQILSRFPNLQSLIIVRDQLPLPSVFGPPELPLNNVNLEHNKSERLKCLKIESIRCGHPGKVLIEVAKAFPNLEAFEISHQVPNVPNNDYEPMSAGQLHTFATNMPHLRELHVDFNLCDMTPMAAINALMPALPQMKSLCLGLNPTSNNYEKGSSTLLPNSFENRELWFADVMGRLSQSAPKLDSLVLMDNSIDGPEQKISNEVVEHFLTNRAPIKQLRLGLAVDMTQEAQEMILSQMRVGSQRVELQAQNGTIAWCLG